MLDIVVVNKYTFKDQGDRTVVSVMRPSVLGNPYSHMEGTKAQFKVATRDEAVAAYRPWLWREYKKNGAVRRELERLFELAGAGKLALLCCCAPKSCHADVIRSCLEWMCTREVGGQGVAPVG